MDPRLLRYYEDELSHLREVGAEFAREFPKVAARLALEKTSCADPYVERLLEGFAFMAARVQLKVDAQFPRFTQHLLNLVYPHYLAPTPSMALVQFQPLPKHGSLAAGFTVPRGASLRTVLSPDAEASLSPCEYTTAHDVVLWPLELVSARYSTVQSELSALRMPEARAVLRLQLRATAGLTFDQLALDRLPLYIRGSDGPAMRMYEQLHAAARMLVARSTTTPDAWQERLSDPVGPLGFEDSQALLPPSARSFSGYRLLQEYFAFAERFMFVELRGLQRAVRRCRGSELELLIGFDRAEPSLEGSVDRERFQLFSTPAINLVARRTDRIELSDRHHEYMIVPDRNRPLDLEVHTVHRVLGYGARGEPAREFLPLYAAGDHDPGDRDRAYHTISRRRRMLSARQRSYGPRSTYVGSDVFVSLVDGAEGPYRPQLRQLAVETLCTNRDLPLLLPQVDLSFTLQSGAPVERVRCLAGPTSPRASHAEGQHAWRLISHLSLNYLSLAEEAGGQDARALREMLTLYAEIADPKLIRQVQGLTGVAARGISRPLPFPGRVSYGRGLEITLSCDETAFEGSGAFLLGTVLERFFAKYVSINAFTETVLKTTQRGEIMRWTKRRGQRHLL